jgi:DNA-binding GntR family transcriptional regulator
MTNPSQALLRRAPQRSTERLDRDRQAAPQVFDRLRELITSLALPPGSALSRTALAEQFGLSSTPIRDALMRLDEEGLVEVFPQHATVVSRIDVKLAQQAHFLRQALELEIVRALALNHGPGLVDELNETIAQQQRCAKAGDFTEFMAADNDFHRQLYAAADKLALWALVQSRSGHIDRLRRLHLPSPGKAQDIVRHHKLIVKAIDASAPDAAQQHLRTHLSGTLAYLDKIRARHPEYLSD